MSTFSSLFAATATTAVLLGMPLCAQAQQAEIPRAKSTPQTPKNWVGPSEKIFAQQLVDEIRAAHPEVMSITVHAVPPGQPADAYTMIAGTFPDRIGNTSSPGDIITAKKGVTQVESKWGTPDFGRKVSVVLPLKSFNGAYLPVAMVIAFYQSPQSGRTDTDFMAPGLAIRDLLSARLPDSAALFAKAQ